MTIAAPQFVGKRCCLGAVVAAEVLREIHRHASEPRMKIYSATLPSLLRRVPRGEGPSEKSPAHPQRRRGWTPFVHELPHGSQMLLSLSAMPRWRTRALTRLHTLHGTDAIAAAGPTRKVG